MKHCPRCNSTLPHHEFYNKTTASDGKQAWCIECFDLYMHTVHGKPRLKRFTNV